MTTGQRIKAFRKKRGITQEDLGAILGVSGSMIAQYETDKRNPKIETLKKIADALGVHYLDLYGTEKSLEIAGYIRAGMKLATEKIENEPYNISVEYVKYLQKHGYEFSEGERQAVSLFNRLNDETQELVITDLARLCLNPRLRKDGKSYIEDEDTPGDTPQSPPASQEGQSTTPPLNAPETPPEGE